MNYEVSVEQKEAATVAPSDLKSQNLIELIFSFFDKIKMIFSFSFISVRFQLALSLATYNETLLLNEVTFGECHFKSFS